MSLRFLALLSLGACSLAACVPPPAGQPAAAGSPPASPTTQPSIAAGWPAGVTTVAAGATVTGDLAAGKKIALEWANTSNMGCWTSLENKNFSGNHVFYATSLPANTTLKVTVEPAAGVDVSLYGVLLAKTQYDVPPQLRAAASCRAGYATTVGGKPPTNPGTAETISLTSAADGYNVLIGVAGANEATSGAFTLKLQ